MDPTLFAFALGMGSAITLAGANTFVKAATDILGARTAMTATGSVLGLAFPFGLPALPYTPSTLPPILRCELLWLSGFVKELH